MKKTLPTREWQEIRHWLSDSRRMVLLSHENPDGDSLGANLALSEVLQNMGHDVYVLVPNAFPSFLTWMPGAETCINYETHPDYAVEVLESADVIFCLDFNDTTRSGGLSAHLAAAAAPKILIDHHLDPKNEFTYVISDPSASSTSELIYQFLVHLGLKTYLSKTVAENLFVGIMTDTGSFSYSCDHPEAFQITAELIERGLEPERIHRLVYDTYSESRMRLLGYCLSERLVVLPEYGTAYISLSLQDLDNFGYENGDTEGVVNYALAIKDVCLAALFTEKEDHVKISFRSKGDFAVNELARKHFHGGGHKNASGGRTTKSLQESIRLFEEILLVYKKDLECVGSV